MAAEAPKEYTPPTAPVVDRRRDLSLEGRTAIVTGVTSGIGKETAFVLARAAREKFIRGGSIVAMTFDSQHVFPHYNVMGVCKSALETIAKYLARDLGPDNVRVNSLSAGPQRTMAATHIPGFDQIAESWDSRSPVGWDLDEDRYAVADSAVYLLSDRSRKVTGEVHHVDGGFHSMALPIKEPAPAETATENPPAN